MDKFLFLMGLLLLGVLAAVFWMPLDWLHALALDNRGTQLGLCSVTALFIVAAYTLRRPPQLVAERGVIERNVLVGAIAVLVMAGLLEVGQRFTADRHAGLTDFLLNAIAMLLSAFLVLLLARWAVGFSRAMYPRSLREEAKTLRELAQRSNDTADTATLQAMADKFERLADEFEANGGTR